MDKVKQMKFLGYIDKAINNRFTQNKSICSFYLLCPKNGQPTIITYNGKKVGIIENGKIILSEFNGQTWKGYEFKYEMLTQLKQKYETKTEAEEEVNGNQRKEEGDTIRVSDDKKAKRKVSKRKVKPKRKQKS